ncbi:hypothetical protein JTE90_014659 [Oedothorax gibbosus]|uniref:Transmembrane protein n=1 Tax=Oedothorax gibbosus TaxID=931172 RepID=A0AAV6VAJ3_9ARAC|nr:hypothetical protein JTE90_014659 [Oedothorax gibbosus]
MQTRNKRFQHPFLHQIVCSRRMEGSWDDEDNRKKGWGGWREMLGVRSRFSICQSSFDGGSAAIGERAKLFFLLGYLFVFVYVLWSMNGF